MGGLFESNTMGSGARQLKALSSCRSDFLSLHFLMTAAALVQILSTKILLLIEYLERLARGLITASWDNGFVPQGVLAGWKMDLWTISGFVLMFFNALISENVNFSFAAAADGGGLEGVK